MNDRCQWPENTAGDSTLVDGVRLAEDLAIRFADGQRDQAAWRGNREGCEARLFIGLAAEHGTDVAAVLAARASLDQRRFDWLVSTVMLVLVVPLSLTLARAVDARFSSMERAAAMLALTGGAVALSFAVVIGGEVVAALIEAVRIGNGHLSYRAARIPWRQHRGATVALTCAVVALAYGVQAAMHRRRVS